jgi:hypothetical protein
MADIDTLPLVDDLPDVDGSDTPVELISAQITISFTATSTIGDSGLGLGVFSIGDRIQISGAGAGTNDGKIVTAATVAAGTITVNETNIDTVAAGSAVTLTRLDANPILNEGFVPRWENPNPSSPSRSG